MRKKVLFIANHRIDRSPGQRFRFEQYLDFLEQNGYDWELSNIISEKDDQVLYQKGKFIQKGIIELKSWFKRWKDARKADDFDIIFVFREALLTGNTAFERKFSKSSAKVIFDFDDAIWLSNVSEGNKSLQRLKNPLKTSQIIGYSDLVFAGNQYLADYASQNNKNVVIIPTTIDTNEYLPSESKLRNIDLPLCIGWSGSVTTIQHFTLAIPFLIRIKEKYGDRVSFKVIGDANYKHDELGIKGLAWSKQTELDDLQSFDIGIMPLPNDKWSKGKCGLKGLQYMALEIPTIMSPVGVNTEIITDRENGFLADDTEAWVDKISLLIESEELRLRIGKAARRTVIERYSTDSQKKRYLNYFNELTEQ